MKLRLPKTRRYRIYLYILCAIIILVALDLVLVRIGRHITVAPDTTHITSPLKPNGMPDYVAALDALSSRGIAPDNNAVPLLVAAFGPERFGVRRRGENFYIRLGMERLPEDGNYLQKFNDYLVMTRPGTRPGDPAIDKRLERFQARLWRALDDPELAAWINSQSAPLDLLHQASLRSQYYLPLFSDDPDQSMIAVILPNLQHYRNGARALILRAMLQAGEGDFGAACKDLLTVHRLARLYAQGSTIIELLVAMGIEREAAQAEVALATTAPHTPAQARAYLKELDGLAPYRPYADSLRGERFATLDLVIYASRHGVGSVEYFVSANPEPPWWGPKVRDLIPSNYNAALRDVNNYYDGMISASTNPTYALRIKAAADREQHLVDRKAKSSFWNSAERAFLTVVPALSGAQRMYDAQSVHLDLTRLCLALDIYRADHESFPDSLARLAPDYLPSIPNDLFADAPFRYARTANAGESEGYFLYSIGPNAKDDGGLSRDARDKAHPDFDDLPIRVPSPHASSLPGKATP